MIKLILSIPVFLFFAAHGQINPKPPSEKPAQSAPAVSQSPAVTRNTPQLSISDFGAVGNGSFDNADAIKNAVEYVIAHPQKLIVPIGNFFTSRSIIARNPLAGRFFTLHLEGILSNKSSSNEYLSRITYGSKSGFALGIQLGRSIEIENITILGQYSFPHSVTNHNIATLKFADWIDPAVTDSRYAPYAGISIDPYPTGSGGTSDVIIKNCAIKQFMVGIALSPNPSTLNDEMISILDCDIEAVRVAIAIGQDQSKEIHIDRLKVWGSTHTVIDGVNYGRGTGGGSVDMYGGNIAGNVNQLVNINTDRFNFTSYGLHAESLFRIGTIRGGAGANFIVPQIDFLTGPGLPAADYILYGNANFYGGCLRYYDDQPNHRLNLAAIDGYFRDMSLNTPPITYSLQGYPGGGWDHPQFENIHLYYNQGTKKLKDNFDDLIKFDRAVPPKIDRQKWTATLTPTDYDFGNIKVGDYILGAPGSSSKRFYDQGLNPNVAPTLQIGRVTRKEKGIVYLDDVGLNVFTESGYDALYISRIK